MNRFDVGPPALLQRGQYFWKGVGKLSGSKNKIDAQSRQIPDDVVAPFSPVLSDRESLVSRAGSGTVGLSVAAGSIGMGLATQSVTAAGQEALQQSSQGLIPELARSSSTDTAPVNDVATPEVAALGPLGSIEADASGTEELIETAPQAAPSEAAILAADGPELDFFVNPDSGGFGGLDPDDDVTVSPVDVARAMPIADVSPASAEPTAPLEITPIIDTVSDATQPPPHARKGNGR